MTQVVGFSACFFYPAAAGPPELMAITLAVLDAIGGYDLAHTALECRERHWALPSNAANLSQVIEEVKAGNQQAGRNTLDAFPKRYTFLRVSFWVAEALRLQRSQG